VFLPFKCLLEKSVFHLQFLTIYLKLNAKFNTIFSSFDDILLVWGATSTASDDGVISRTHIMVLKRLIRKTFLQSVVSFSSTKVIIINFLTGIIGNRQDLELVNPWTVVREQCPSTFDRSHSSRVEVSFQERACAMSRFHPNYSHQIIKSHSHKKLRDVFFLLA